MTETTTSETNDLDVELKKLDRDKRIAEIEELRASRRTRWITPAALAALLPLLGGIGFWIVGEIKQYNEAYQALEVRDELVAQKKSLREDLAFLLPMKEEYARQAKQAQQDLQRLDGDLEDLQKKEAVLRQRNDAVNTIEEHGGLVRLLASDASLSLKWTLAVETEITESTLHLSLNNFELDDPVHDALATLLQFDQPAIVEFRNVHDIDEKLSVLVKTLKANDIRQLTLWNTSVSDEGLDYLKPLTDVHALVIIDGAAVTNDRNDELVLVDGRQLTKPSMEALARPAQFTVAGVMRLSKALPKCIITYPRPSLRDSLDRSKQLIAGMSLDEVRACAIEALNEVVASPADTRVDSSTETLDLSAVDTSGGLSALEALPNLKSLVLPYDVQDSDFEFLTQLKNLRTLKVSGTFINETVLRYISTIEKLQVLAIAVRTEGLDQLGQLSDLEELTLFGFEVSDTSVPVLLSLRKLRKLDVSHTRISKEGVERLREGLPNCQINPELLE